MFGNPLWQQLHTKIARYIAPYDAVARSYSLDKAKIWIRDAEAQHQQMLVAFYHSEYTPTKLPSVAPYQHDVQKFIKLFPKVRQYQSWDEANRGNVPARRSRAPRRRAAAQYYQALIRVCNGCTAIGLDVLDPANISPTLRYISEFKREIGRLRTVMPKIWGLHNYSDINRLRKLAHARTLARARRSGVADRDRRAREVRRRLPQHARLGPDAGGEGAQVHVQRRRLPVADQAPVHLRLDRRRSARRASTPG